jgi:hypothetical protein
MEVAQSFFNYILCLNLQVLFSQSRILPFRFEYAHNIYDQNFNPGSGKALIQLSQCGPNW